MPWSIEMTESHIENLNESDEMGCDTMHDNYISNLTHKIRGNKR